MIHTYMSAIGEGFPAVGCHTFGDGTVYEDIVWDAGEPIPSQETLDVWIAANTRADALTITKYEFRKLFTFNERVAIDSAPANTNIPANYRAILTTMNKDMELSGMVVLSNPDVAAGVNFLETLGLIAAGRATRILNNLPPL